MAAESGVAKAHGNKGLDEVSDPASVFEEQQPVEVGEGEPQKFDAVVVRRDPSLTNQDLPWRHTELVGNAILNKLVDEFGDTALAIPMPKAGSRPDLSVMLAAFRQMANLFVVQGFVFDGDMSATIGKDLPHCGPASFCRRRRRCSLTTLR